MDLETRAPTGAPLRQRWEDGPVSSSDILEIGMHTTAHGGLNRFFIGWFRGWCEVGYCIGRWFLGILRRASRGDFARTGEFATVGAVAKDSSGGKVLSGWEAESGDRLALHLLCFAHCRSVGAIALRRAFSRALEFRVGILKAFGRGCLGEAAVRAGGVSTGAAVDCAVRGVWGIVRNC